MRKLFFLLVLASGMLVAQTPNATNTQTIGKFLKLSKVPSGLENDNVLVRGTDGIVKSVPRSEFGSGTPPVPTIQQVIEASPDPDGYGASIYDKTISLDNFFSLFKRKLSISASSIDLFKYEDNLYDVDSRISISETAIFHKKKYNSEVLGYELSPLGLILIRSIDGGGNIQQSLKFPQQTLSQPERVIPISVNGNYADLNGNITIAGGSQVNSDWNATTGAAQILNKPLILPSYINSTIEDLGIGDNALTPLSTEGYNLAIGNWALSGNTTGTQNVGLGHYSLSYNTVGNYNVAIGVSALENSTGVASYNTAVGAGAQRTSQGGQNTSLGAISGDKITGNFNTTIGFQSGRALTSGNRNILIEMPYNDGVTTGSNNIIIDGQNQCGIITGSGNTIIGGYNGTVPNLSNQVYIGTGGGISRFEVDANGIYKLVAGAPVYTDNAAALSGGLVAGNIYRTATGQLMITY